MNTKTNIQSATQQPTHSTSNTNNNITTTSALPRVDFSSHQTTIPNPNATLSSREINQEPFKFTAERLPQAIDSMNEAIQNLPDIRQLQENQTIEYPNKENPFWKLIVQGGTLFWLFMFMKMTIMMPVFKDQ